MKRALGLVRVSTEGQTTDAWGIPEQRAAITAYCARHALSLLELCEDGGVTGQLRDRPAVRRALELAQAHAFDVLVLVKLDRIGRSNRVIQDLLYQFRSLGIRVQFVEHGGDDTPSDRLLLNVLGGVSEFEAEMIRARTMAGRRRKAESGRFPTNFSLLGYHCVRRWEQEADPSQLSGTLRVKEDEARIVHELFTRYAAGASLGALARWLNEAGIRTTRGNPWAQTTLRPLLSNPAYYGEARYGWRKVEEYIQKLKDGREKKRVRTQRQVEWITVPCPPIVERELWDRVAARLADNRESYPGRPSCVWLLRGCVECAECRRKKGGAEKAYGKRKAGVRVYVCPQCSATITAEKWEQRALNALREAVAPGVMAKQAAAQARKEIDAAGDVEGLIGRHQRELAAIDAEERKLLEVALRFSASVVEEKARQLQQRRLIAEAMLRELFGTAGRGERPEAAAARAEELAALARAELEGAGEDRVRLQALFRRFIRITLRRRRTPIIEVTVGG